VARRSPVEFHNFWGQFASYADLPNVLGSTTQNANLQTGDIAYVTGTSQLYFCTNATFGPPAAAVWSAAGSGSPAQEYFAPKYVVGCTLAPYNDSATTYSTGGFYYIPDPGDGSGIATALSYATSTDPAFKAAGDVWIRPGTYDLTQAGSPTTAFAVPNGILVRGSGPSTVISGRLAGDQRVFTLGATSELRDLRINVIGEYTGTGDGLIECGGASTSPSWIERVDVQLENTSVGSSTIRAAVYATGTASVFSCRFFIEGSDPQTFVGGICAVASRSTAFPANVSRCVVAAVRSGYDSAFVALNSGRLTVSESRTSGSQIASVFSGAGAGGFSVSVSECDFAISAASASCVSVDCAFKVSDCTFATTGAATSAIVSTATRGIITGNNIDGDIDTSGGTNHVLTTNLISSASTLTFSASDENAHNIIY
jgi:hypothetical protein